MQRSLVGLSSHLLPLAALAKEGHSTLLLLGEMVHFVRQLQGFCQLEVIEYSWHDLQTFFAKRQGDLDELIESHRAYLNALIGKVLLRSGKKGTVVSCDDVTEAWHGLTRLSVRRTGSLRKSRATSTPCSSSPLHAMSCQLTCSAS